MVDMVGLSKLREVEGNIYQSRTVQNVAVNQIDPEVFPAPMIYC
jgi:hypothetical protein